MPVIMEKRIVWDVYEINAVIIRCQCCGAEVPVRDFVIGPDTRSRVFHANSCPHCGDPWKPDNQGDHKDLDAAQKLIEALEHFTNAEFKERLSRDVDKRPREKEVKRIFRFEFSSGTD